MSNYSDKELDEDAIGDGNADDDMENAMSFTAIEAELKPDPATGGGACSGRLSYRTLPASSRTSTRSCTTRRSPVYSDASTKS
jgi:hypothetical protein